MKVSGTLTGLTPKDKKEGPMLEIKITALFDHQDLGDLGALFGLPVIVDITSQQQELGLKAE